MQELNNNEILLIDGGSQLAYDMGRAVGVWWPGYWADLKSSWAIAMSQ